MKELITLDLTFDEFCEVLEVGLRKLKPGKKISQLLVGKDCTEFRLILDDEPRKNQT